MKVNIFKYVAVFFFLSPAISIAQEKFDFYISKEGNDINPGTSKLLPKKTIAAIAPLLKKFYAANGSVKLGLQSGGTWEENLVTSYPIQLNTFSDNSNQKGFAILNGSKEFSAGWEKQNGTGYTFKQDIPYKGFVGYGINGIGSYSYIYVLEIDKTLEKTAPITARRLLKFVPYSTDVESTPGSYNIPIDSKENPIPVFIHTSDGSSPNSNLRYRYEITVRDWAVNSTYEKNSRFENLWVRGFGAGNGMLPGGDNSYYNKIIFGPGASVHHLVVRSGTINHSLFLPGPKNTNGYAVVFYDTEGLGRHCTIKNSMFLDIRLPVYAHTSLGTNYGAVEIDNVIGFSDASEANGFMYTSNNDTVILNNVYIDGYIAGYYYGTAKSVTISNSWFKDVNFGIAYSALNPVTSSVNNVFIKTKGTTNSSGISMQGNTTLKLSNSIIHVVNNNKSYNRIRSDFFLYGSSGTAAISASGNIFICDIDPSRTLTAALTNTDKGIASSKDSWNNNIYVLLRGNKILWNTTNPSTNGGNPDIQNFDDWKKQSGQDQNSLFFDLRYDRRGLKAIFVDPDNGNYDLANTPEGKQIAGLRAGMTSPITCFVQKPTYEEAADLIRNNKTLSVNTCRNPCQQNKIRVNNTFDLSTINNRQVKLQWNIAEQQNINYYEIQRSRENSLFTRIGSVPVSPDSLYSFIDDIQPGISYSYRLSVIAKAAGKCYSEIRNIKINDNKAITVYPNPSTGKILVSLNGSVGGANFTISNSMGQVILVKESLSLYRAIELDLTNQPKGIYTLKMETSKGMSIQKFILQ